MCTCSTKTNEIPNICKNECKRFNTETQKCKKGLQPKHGLFNNVYCKRMIPKQ